MSPCPLQLRDLLGRKGRFQQSERQSAPVLVFAGCEAGVTHNLATLGKSG